ncbi:HAMP domain-containing histidine kinase [Candidatus Saccharibacteria bacterium]|nr:HAMP domain-containing histidine kinase [Candidatus Saccharibacteria bacterium]
MSSEGISQPMVVSEEPLSDSVLSMATAGELASPLVLMRQLSLAISAAELSDDERQLLGKRLSLTSERALRLASSLAMATNAQQQLPLEPINPLSVCQDVVHELSPLFTAHGQKIILRSRTRVPLLVGNRRVLQQILMSFGDNALQYCTEKSPIRMTITSHGKFVRIGVRDYGPAVPIDIWQKIDERVARRASAPIATRPTTSAIGLITARRLAKMMGSAVGHIRHRDGATFYIDLNISGQMSLL